MSNRYKNLPAETNVSINETSVVITNQTLDKKGRDMILQPNGMAYSRYDAEAVQIKVFYLIVNNLQKQIRQSINKEGDEYLFDYAQQKEIAMRFSLGDLTSDCRRYGEVKKLLRRLPDIVVEIPVKDNNTGKKYMNVGSIIRSVSIPIETYNTEFIVTLNKDVASVLLNAKNRGYRELMLQTVLNSKSKYTQRLYDIFAGFKSQKVFDMNVKALREILKLDRTYRYWSQFKNRVLDTAQKELKKLYDYNLSDFCFYYNFEEPVKGDPVSIQIVLELADFAEERAKENRFTSLRIQVTEQLKAWNIYNYKMPQRIGMMNDKQLIVFSECINETKSKIEREQGAINNIASFARKTLSEIFEKRQKTRDETIDSVEQDATNYYYLSDDSNCNGIEKKLFEKIKNKIHPDIFNTYIRPCGLKIDLGEKQVKVTMVAPSKFVVDKIEINYRDHLREAIKEVFPAKNPYLVYHIK